MQVPVDTPLPDECFNDYAVSTFPEQVTFLAYQTWVDSVIDSLLLYRQQNGRCRALNRDRFQEAQPVELGTASEP